MLDDYTYIVILSPFLRHLVDVVNAVKSLFVSVCVAVKDDTDPPL